MQYLRVLSVWQKTWDKQLNRRKDLLLLMSAEVSVHSPWVLHLLGPMNRNVLRGSFWLLSGWGLGRRKRGQEGSFKVTFTENDVLPLGPNSSYCSGDQAFNAQGFGEHWRSDQYPCSYLCSTLCPLLFRSHKNSYVAILGVELKLLKSRLVM